MKTTLHVRRIMRDSIRMYFAPLTGAFKGIRAEFYRIDGEIARHHVAEQKREAARNS